MSACANAIDNFFINMSLWSSGGRKKGRPLVEMAGHGCYRLAQFWWHRCVQIWIEGSSEDLLSLLYSYEWKGEFGSGWLLCLFIIEWNERNPIMISKRRSPFLLPSIEGIFDYFTPKHVWTHSTWPAMLASIASITWHNVIESTNHSMKHAFIYE